MICHNNESIPMVPNWIYNCTVTVFYIDVPKLRYNWVPKYFMNWIVNSAIEIVTKVF